MIMGDRGTGKSTTIRALADLLPAIDVTSENVFSKYPDPIKDYKEIKSNLIYYKVNFFLNYLKTNLFDEQFLLKHLFRA